MKLVTIIFDDTYKLGDQHGQRNKLEPGQNYTDVNFMYQITRLELHTDGITRGQNYA